MKIIVWNNCYLCLHHVASHWSKMSVWSNFRLGLWERCQYEPHQHCNAPPLSEHLHSFQFYTAPVHLPPRCNSGGCWVWVTEVADRDGYFESPKSKTGDGARITKCRRAVGYCGTPWSGQLVKWNCVTILSSLDPSFCSEKVWVV